MAYFWIKALHIISVIFWMAGLLYLPRLMVYHCDATPGGEMSEKLKIMERRLLRFIVTPAMIAAWIFGLGLFFLYHDWQGWFIAKLALVIAMSGFAGLLAGHVRAFAGDRNAFSRNYFRWINELPGVLAIIIVILAVVVRHL